MSQGACLRVPTVCGRSLAARRVVGREQSEQDECGRRVCPLSHMGCASGPEWHSCRIAARLRWRARRLRVPGVCASKRGAARRRPQGLCPQGHRGQQWLDVSLRRCAECAACRGPSFCMGPRRPHRSETRRAAAGYRGHLQARDGDGRHEHVRRSANSGWAPPSPSGDRLSETGLAADPADRTAVL